MIGAPVSGASTLLTSTQPLAQESTLDPQRTYRIRLVPHLETSRSLAFDPVVRELLPIVVPSGISPSIAAASVTAVGPTVNGRLPALILKIGRFTDKLPAPTGLSTSGAGDNEGASASSGGVPQGPGIVGGAAMTIAGGGGDITSSKVAFKSKVVSRSHAEIWCENGGKVR